MKKKDVNIKTALIIAMTLEFIAIIAEKRKERIQKIFAI